MPVTVKLTGKAVGGRLQGDKEVEYVRFVIVTALADDRQGLRESINQGLEDFVIPRDYAMEYTLGSWPDALLGKYLTMIHEGRIPIRLQGLIDVLERTEIPTDDVVEDVFGA